MHFQVISMVSDTKIKIAPYIFARLLHALLAGLTTYVLMIMPIGSFESLVIPAFAMFPQSTSELVIHIQDVFRGFFVVIFIVCFLSIIVHLVKNLNIGFEVIKILSGH